MFAQLTFIAEENLIIHTNIVFITQTSHTTVLCLSHSFSPDWRENCLFAQLFLMIISCEEITTGHQYNEYPPEFQMENYNLEDNQSVRSNLSLIQVAPTPTFATGN